MTSNNSAIAAQLHLLEALSDETNMEIYLNLLIYPRLTLTQLTQIISKSRATIHRHLKLLNEKGLIIIHEEKSRGRFPKQVYQIKVPDHPPTTDQSSDPSSSPSSNKKSSSAPPKFNPLTFPSPQREQIHTQLQATILTSLSYMTKIIQKTTDFIKGLHCGIGESFEKTYYKTEQGDLSLEAPSISLTFYSRELYLDLMLHLQSSMTSWMVTNQDLIQKSFHEARPYALSIMGIPIHRIMGAIPSDEEKT
ncbi:hypothetical protein ES708_22900 [subsurface metagenome]